MAFSYTSDDLVASIKVRGRVPTSQSTFTAARLMKLADEEIGIGLLPKIMKVRENYYLHEKDHTITADTAAYRLPDRAIGMKLKNLRIVDSNGDVGAPLTLIEEEDKHLYQNSQNGNYVFYIKNNSAILVPTPAATQDTLRMSFFIRPSTLVAVSSAAKVASINSGSNQVTVTSLPSTITTSTAVDFVRGTGGFECLAIDQTITNIASTTLTFSSLPTGLAVNDYICLAGESPIPQIPAELHTVLSLRVTVTVLESLGFINEMRAVQGKLKEAEEAVSALLSPRVDGSPKKIINRNSLLNSRSRQPF